MTTPTTPCQACEKMRELLTWLDKDDSFWEGTHKQIRAALALPCSCGTEQEEGNLTGLIAGKPESAPKKAEPEEAQNAELARVKAEFERQVEEARSKPEPALVSHIFTSDDEFDQCAQCGCSREEAKAMACVPVKIETRPESAPTPKGDSL